MRPLVLSGFCVATTLTIAPHIGWSQGAASARPRFDVVSIKKNENTGAGRINLTQPGGHLFASNVNVRFLIIQAYQFGHVQFAPNPPGAGWMESEHFDVEAEVEGNPTVAEKRLMLQSLLAEEFKLRIHEETRQLPEYALVVSKAGRTGPELRRHRTTRNCVDVPAGQPNPAPSRGAALTASCGSGIAALGNPLVGQNVTMLELARALEVLVDRKVVDRTRLLGAYDLTLRFDRAPLNADANESDPSVPSIFTALQEQLGLKLQSIKGPVEVQVIDHVERPSEN